MRRTFIVAAACVLLAGSPALAQEYLVGVTFENASSEKAIANLHDNSRGARLETQEVGNGQSKKWVKTWYAAGESDQEYDLSFTADGGRKCSYTLRLTKDPGACTIVPDLRGLTCDGASIWGTFSIMGTFSKPGCEATIRFDK